MFFMIFMFFFLYIFFLLGYYHARAHDLTAKGKVRSGATGECKPVRSLCGRLPCECKPLRLTTVSEEHANK